MIVKKNYLVIRLTTKQFCEFLMGERTKVLIYQGKSGGQANKPSWEIDTIAYAIFMETK